jgi:hypothetical protein
MNIDKQSIESIQKFMLSPGARNEWLSSDQSTREELCEFKTVLPSGECRIIGGKVVDAASPYGFFIYCKFNDLKGMSHTVRFLPYWLPKDCNQVAQQCYINFNEMLGRDPWVDISPVKKIYQNLVLPGRLKEED